MNKKALVGTAALVAVLSMSASLSGAASQLPAAKQRVKITMSLKGPKLEIPSCLAVGHTLAECAVFGVAPFSYKLTVHTTVNGKPMKGNEGMEIVTNDRAERELCGITSSKSNADWCDIDIPNPGRFTITAEYGPDYWKLEPSGPSHKGVTATKKLVVKFWTCNTNGVCWD